MSKQLNLSEVSKGIELSSSLDSLADQIQLRRAILSEFVAEEIIKLFKWSVGSTVVITIALVIIDTGELAFGLIHADQRLITEKVLMTLIGASVVQVGSAAAAIAYSLFKQKSPNVE